MAVIVDQPRRVPLFLTYGTNIIVAPATFTFNASQATAGTVGAGTNPITGVANAQRFATAVGAGTHNITLSSAVSLTAAATYTYSYDVKAETAQFVQLLFDPSINTGFANFDLVNSTVTLSSGVAPNIVDLGGGWRRISVTFTSIGTVAIASNLYLMFISTGLSARNSAISVTSGQETSILACNLQVVTGAVANAV